MDDIINSLDDDSAQRILATIARVRLRAEAEKITCAHDIAEELAAKFDISPSQEPVLEGELARAALCVLAEDPSTREAIQVMATNLSGEGVRFEPVTAIALTTAALVVLQTHVRFERDKQGKWTVKIEKQATKNSLLKLLVQRILAYIPKP